jgi:hypothetical protein
MSLAKIKAESAFLAAEGIKAQKPLKGVDKGVAYRAMDAVATADGTVDSPKSRYLRFSL